MVLAMLTEKVVATTILLGSGGIVAGVSTLPPLTASTGSSTAVISSLDDVDVAQSEATELAFCRQNAAHVNCLCYSSVSGHILASERPKIRGYTYADQTTLARTQGKHTC
jgi:hypothetical protein